MTSRDSSSVAVRLRQTELRLHQQLEPLLRPLDLLMDHWRILAVIGDSPGIGMTSVAAAAVVPAATLTRHADRLVELGLVLRHVDPSDRRRVVVSLSPRGQQLAAEMHEAEQRAIGATGVRLSPATSAAG